MRDAPDGGARGAADSAARERWDPKHAAREGQPLAPPDAFFTLALAALHRRRRAGPGTRSLDLASGAGRHSLVLLASGHEVEAWDVSPVAFARLAREAARAAGGGAARLRTREVDLEAGAPPAVSPFDLVVLVDFLDRPLLARVSELVRPGGHLVVATFTEDREGERPSARYCLARGELAAGVPGFRTLEHEEHGGRAGLLAEREAGA